MGSPRTQILNPTPDLQSGPAPATDFGFQSTVATPRAPTQGLAQGLGGGLSQPPPSYGGGSTGGGRSVVVDMGDSGEIVRYRQMAEDARTQLDMVRAERDKEVAENKRLRAEHSNITQRLEDSKTQMRESEEVIDGLKRLVEDMRSENEQTRERDGRITSQMAEVQEDLASRTRQLQRANDEIAKTKSETEQYKRQVVELTRMKDEGFNKLNEQLAEVEHLREVIREQERMLEERRVGLISLEEAMKDLRTEREQRIKEIAQLKGERDEVRIGFNRQVAALQSTEEENRRLGRLMQELQAGGAEREVSRLSADLREARSEEQRLTAENERLDKELVSVVQRADRLQRQLDNLQESGGAEEERVKAAEQQQRKAEEARVKAESARLRAEEDKAAAIKAREELQQENAALKQRLSEQSSRGSDDKRSGAEDELQRRISELETRLEDASSKATAAARRYEEAEDRARRLEQEAQRSKSAKPSGGGGGDPLALRERAGEVYQNINDVLSELKVNISVVREEFEAFSGNNPDARSRTIRDAIEAAVGQTEDVKGVLRALREISEG